MVTLETLQDDIYHGSHQTYQCDRPINLYSTSLCQGLVTQADAGHQLHVYRNRQAPGGNSRP